MSTRDYDKNQFSAILTPQERAMADKLKRHYNFKTDKELITALIKRAHLSMVKSS